MNEQVMKNAFADNYQRLVEIKKLCDPNNLFRYNYNINPQRII
ncbi:BBE domain-containing protein [Aquibacillus koreensis]